MIAMTIDEPQENQESPEDLLTAGQAAAYLAKRWGRPKYSTSAFKQLRHRKNLRPAVYIEANSTLWRRGDLDLIPEPSRSNPRPRRRKKQSLDNGN
jgi:hypothetical protein